MRNVDWHTSTEESTLMSGRGYEEDSAKIDVNYLGVKWRVKNFEAQDRVQFWR
jgi:hypothetical protein